MDVSWLIFWGILFPYVVSPARPRDPGLGFRTGCMASFAQGWNASEKSTKHRAWKVKGNVKRNPSGRPGSPGSEESRVGMGRARLEEESKSWLSCHVC